jgi:MFS family permease
VTGAAVPAAMRALQFAALVGAFAFAYFLSALLRAVTATLAPEFARELGLGSADLGLLAGAYFLGFAAMQLPLGRALDRAGPRRVLLALIGVAVVGCAGFALAQGLTGLVAARAMIGVGVSACLMAPLTCFRRRFDVSTQLRLNSWMLMTGSLGMVASTLPVQALLPWLGWRGLFVVLAAAVALSMLLIRLVVPARIATAAPVGAAVTTDGYRAILRHPVFVRNAPLGFFSYGGLVGVQALWAGPWLTRVAGWSAGDAARGLFFINLCMLLAFLAWGFAMPRLVRSGLDADRLITAGLPLSLLGLAGIVVWPNPAGAAAWAAWCVACTFVSLAQPAVGQAFPAHVAGRALSAYNLVIFAGVFCVQWGIGLMIDAARSLGLDEASAFRAAFAVFDALCLLSYVWFLIGRRGADPRAGR